MSDNENQPAPVYHPGQVQDVAPAQVETPAAVDTAPVMTPVAEAEPVNAEGITAPSPAVVSSDTAPVDEVPSAPVLRGMSSPIIQIDELGLFPPKTPVEPMAANTVTSMIDAIANAPVPAATTDTPVATPATPAPADASMTATADAPVDTPEVIEYVSLDRFPDSTTVEQDQIIFNTMASAGRPWDDEAETLILPAEGVERTNQYLESIPKMDPEKDETGQEWAAAIGGSEAVIQEGGFFLKALKRKGAKYRQSVPNKNGNGKPLALSSPVYKDQDISMLTGEAAVIRMRAMMGIGSVMYIPLWQSGFWITLKTPSESSLLDLFQRIEESKIRLGRQTYGLAFANTQVFYANEVFNFMLEHLYESTLKDSSPETLHRMILQPELNTIVHAMACMVWPKGFQYARSVLDAGGRERKVLRDWIDLSKCRFVDTDRLSDRQVAHMSNRKGQSMTEEMVMNYRNDFTNNRPVATKINDVLDITYRIPTVEEYFNSGTNWVNGIVQMTNKVFAKDISDKERNQRITRYAQATNMRQYAHWIESLSFNGSVIKDKATIESMIDDLTTIDEVREKFFETVRGYIDDTTMSIIAVPTNEPEEIKKLQFRKFPNLIPIDPLSVFFILLVQKVRRIATRM